MKFDRLCNAVLWEAASFKPVAKDDNIWYHGSASGDLTKNWRGIHLGTLRAAQQALHATIGFPVEGDWDGTRRYGETLLCGKKRILERDRWGITGYNCNAPDDDFYPTELKEHRATFGSFKKSIPIPFYFRPSIKAYRILCPMGNTIKKPYTDNFANSLMNRIKKQNMDVQLGYYYINIGEDEGKISVVVPDADCLQEVQ